jgi:hypothetical protein
MQSLGIVPTIPGTAKPGVVHGLAEAVPIFEERNFLVTGVTRDGTGVAVGNCVVRLYNTANDTVAQTTTSDASGNYSFIVDKTQAWYAVSYKIGAPDVFGTTANTLAGA